MATTAVGRAGHRAGPRPSGARVRFNAEAQAAILFLLPASIGFVVFYAYPALRGFYLSFTDFDLLRNDGDWVGLDNYQTLLAGHAVLERALDHVQVRGHQHRHPDHARARRSPC